MICKKNIKILRDFKNNHQNRNNILVILFLFLTSIAFCQEVKNDSVWLSIYKHDSINILNYDNVKDYELLFYRKIKVPVYKSNDDTIKLYPLELTLKQLLEQAHLSDSYSVSAIKGTEIEKQLKDFEKKSFPFASCITSKIAEKIDLQSNNPKIVSKDSILYELSDIDTSLISSKKMINLLHENHNLNFNTNAFLRFRLLSYLTGSYNLSPNNYVWKLDKNNEFVPYLNSYDNEFMKFDGFFKIASKIVSRFNNFEPYNNRIKSIKKVSSKFIGFDVNFLSSLSFEVWKNEINFIKSRLTKESVKEIQESLPKGILESDVENIFSVLNQRIENLEEVAHTYYNLVSPNKIVVANDLNNIIDVKRENKETLIEIFNAKEGKTNPSKSYRFSTDDTKEIWIYGLKGNDYFEVFGKSKKEYPILLIGGPNSDKYEIQNGKNILVYDNVQQTFIVQKDKSKVKLSNQSFITNYQSDKYKHTKNTIKPRFGANPDDGFFIGAINELKIFGFDKNPFTTLHSLTVNLYVETLGAKIDYYTEKTNFYKGFHLFGSLGFQSPNHNTNFFGFGNETTYDVNQKQQYNMVKMSILNTKIGVLKNSEKHSFKTNLFFESTKIDQTPDRFVSSETLFFPAEDFFDRKYYSGLFVDYKFKDILLEDLIIKPELTLLTNVDLQNIDKTNFAIQPSLYFIKPMLHNVLIFDSTASYKKVFGNEIPFYQAANLGGNNDLRGYRNQRFTGESLFYSSSNLKCYIKKVKTNILPIKFGVLLGYDIGRVWQEGEDSSKLHNDFGAGIWVQSAEIIKAKLQGFKGSEDFRFVLNVAIDF